MSNSSPELPREFLERLRRIVPDPHFQEVFESFGREKPTSFRVNTLKAGSDSVREELSSQGFALRALEFFPDAFWVDAAQRRRLTESAAATEGRIYIQGLSSMLAPLVLSPQPGEEVLDLAAAPGGKTLQMAALMRNEGRIAAVEAIRSRLYRLETNLRLHGATIVKTYLADGRSIGRKTPQRFDRVLLDAPCSGEARFDIQDPTTWEHWGIRKIKEQARKQYGLIRSALACLKPGGTLLYCTCSLAPEENERVIHGLISELDDEMAILPVNLPLPAVQPGMTEWAGERYHPDVGRSLRILPAPLWDGFFLCLIQRVAVSTGQRGPKHNRRR